MIRWFVFLALSIFVQLAQAAGDANYHLGTGDILSVNVFEEPELSVSKIKLGEDGAILFPMLGEIKVKGLSVLELQQKITASLKGTYLVNPQVTVSVDQYRDIFVNGQVNKPGNYPYQPGLTVRQAVSIAGGFKDRANTDKVTIVHEHQDKSTTTKGDQNTLVQPGDTITVEESFF